MSNEFTPESFVRYRLDELKTELHTVHSKVDHLAEELIKMQAESRGSARVWGLIAGGLAAVATTAIGRFFHL
jgi:hypothetical protein